MSKDPFSWAEDYNRQMTSLGAQGEQNAQNTLMQMFETEARRQAPWSDLPVDLAKQNNQYANMYNNSVATAQAKASMKPMPTPPQIASTISRYAKAYGVDEDSMIVRAQLESGFNPKAANKSGASGLFQFMPKTAEQYGLSDPFNVDANTEAAMKLELDNQAYLKQNGIPITAGTTYLAHQQGAGGAVKLLSNPNAPAESIVGRAAVLQNGGRLGMTAGAFAAMWTNKADRLYEQRKANRRKMPVEAVGPYGNLNPQVAITEADQEEG